VSDKFLLWSHIARTAVHCRKFRERCQAIKPIRTARVHNIIFVKMSSKSLFDSEEDAAQANKLSRKAKESPFMLVGEFCQFPGSGSFAAVTSHGNFWLSSQLDTHISTHIYECTLRVRRGSRLILTLAMSLTSIWGHFLMSLCDITVNAV